MSYWSDVMQDDVYVIAQDGWQANSDLIPPPLIIKRYFAAEQQHIEQLEAARDEITRKLEEMEEKHGGEDSLLEEAKNEKGKITKNSINNRLKDIFELSLSKDKLGRGGTLRAPSEPMNEVSGNGNGGARKVPPFPFPVLAAISLERTASLFLPNPILRMSAHC